MKIRKVHALYFSPGGTTRKVVTHLAKNIAAICCGISCEIQDFTLPAGRSKFPDIPAGELAVVGLPVYAGRLPNLLLNYLAGWKSTGALAVPIVVYGNRSFGNALVELRDFLERAGFHTLAAAAFVGQHSFSDKLAAGRPDGEDLSVAARFAGEISRRVSDFEKKNTFPVKVPGLGAPDYGGYYKPKGEEGEVVNFLKTKPLTTDNCVRCMRCAGVCPMGAIESENPSWVSGICIKCNACIKICPTGAKCFVDEAYSSHVRFLENTYTSPAKIELF